MVAPADTCWSYHLEPRDGREELEVRHPAGPWTLRGPVGLAFRWLFGAQRKRAGVVREATEQAIERARWLWRPVTVVPEHERVTRRRLRPEDEWGWQPYGGVLRLGIAAVPDPEDPAPTPWPAPWSDERIRWAVGKVLDVARQAVDLEAAVRPFGQGLTVLVGYPPDTDAVKTELRRLALSREPDVAERARQMLQALQRRPGAHRRLGGWLVFPCASPFAALALSAVFGRLYGVLQRCSDCGGVFWREAERRSPFCPECGSPETRDRRREERDHLYRTLYMRLWRRMQRGQIDRDEFARRTAAARDDWERVRLGLMTEEAWRQKHVEG